VIRNQEKENELLNINELASLLNVKISKARSMVFKNEIPYIKIGRLVRFNKTEIENWLNQLRRY
jgi:excisionase family DNA binding protein